MLTNDAASGLLSLHSPEPPDPSSRHDLDEAFSSRTDANGRLRRATRPFEAPGPHTLHPWTSRRRADAPLRSERRLCASSCRTPAGKPAIEISLQKTGALRIVSTAEIIEDFAFRPRQRIQLACPRPARRECFRASCPSHDQAPFRSSPTARRRRAPSRRAARAGRSWRGREDARRGRLAEFRSQNPRPAKPIATATPPRSIRNPASASAATPPPRLMRRASAVGLACANAPKSRQRKPNQQKIRRGDKPSSVATQRICANRRCAAAPCERASASRAAPAAGRIGRDGRKNAASRCGALESNVA